MKANKLMSFSEDLRDYSLMGLILTGIAAVLVAFIFVGALIGVALFADGCGHSAKNSELIGQVKSVSMETPLICPDRAEADISLGILRDGSGSMSKHDVDALITKPEHLKIMRGAAETGHLVRVTYDKRRAPWCGPNIIITNVELITNTPPPAEANDGNRPGSDPSDDVDGKAE